jgi:hypothetical protein
VACLNPLHVADGQQTNCKVSCIAVLVSIRCVSRTAFRLTVPADYVPALASQSAACRGRSSDSPHPCRHPMGRLNPLHVAGGLRTPSRSRLSGCLRSQSAASRGRSSDGMPWTIGVVNKSQSAARRGRSSDLPIRHRSRRAGVSIRCMARKAFRQASQGAPADKECLNPLHVAEGLQTSSRTS